jgi:Tfp pilus assembly protein PilF
MNITLNVLMWCAAAALSTAAAALPSPVTDDTVLARVPKRARTPILANANDPAAAARSAQAWIAAARRDHDPRAYGYAQQALAPWWSQPDAPLDVLRARATIYQVDHQFDLAYRDLQRIIALDPRDAQAQIDAATLLTTTARYNEAKVHCQALAQLTRGLVPAMCVAQIEGIVGDARAARTNLSAALQAEPNAAPEIRAWATTLIAELHERVGETNAASLAFAKAMALNPRDIYTRIAFADFLLAQDSAPQVLRLFVEPTDKLPDAALLRLAIAAKRSGHTDALPLANAIGARLRAAGQRGDSPHAREEALYALHMEANASRAAQLALKNWRSQKEPTDALILLAAGRAAKDDAATQAATSWLQATRFQHPALNSKAR